MTSKELYQALCDPKNLEGYCWEKQNQGDGMSVLAISIQGWWKPIFLMDDRNKSAVQFMSMSEHLLTVTDEDIDWTTVTANLEGYRNARTKYAGFPTNIRGFRNGLGNVEWQINPDGRYFMDEDGFGMTNDEEISLWGIIDRNGRVVSKFTYKE